jgi:hypothetical protein
MSNNPENKSGDHPASQSGNGIDESRREAMLRLAKYTAPVMLAVLLSEKAVGASIT